MSGTAPVFALGAASLFLGEDIPRRAVVSCAAIVVGLAILSWKQSAVRPNFTPRLLLWPISGALLRGLAQAAAKAGLALWPNPFAASLIGYFVSSATVIAANRVAHPTRPPLNRPGVAWFAATGLLNGCAVLLMYGALNIAPVSLVAPVVATYPLIAALVSAAVLREEPLTLRMLVGALTMVLAVIYLLAPGADAKTFAPGDVLRPVACARG
jgi:drug/metabolite transporter (DMT)-like permease